MCLRERSADTRYEAFGHKRSGTGATGGGPAGGSDAAALFAFFSVSLESVESIPSTRIMVNNLPTCAQYEY